MRIISGNSNLSLAREIAKFAGCPLSKAHISRFADGEIRVEIHENIIKNAHPMAV